MMLGMSQTDIGEALGVNLQQIQKYEMGLDRISAGLHQIAGVLGVALEFFFEGTVAEADPAGDRAGRSGHRCVRAAALPGAVPWRPQRADSV
jgi:transcriptional regulator with XRE-family HTH domain